SNRPSITDFACNTQSIPVAVNGRDKVALIHRDVCDIAHSYSLDASRTNLSEYGERLLETFSSCRQVSRFTLEIAKIVLNEGHPSAIAHRAEGVAGQHIRSACFLR